MMRSGVGWGFWVMALVWLFVLALIIVGVFLVARQQSRRGGPPPSGREKTTKQILDERLAKGEISQEEYDQLRDKLKE